jgi:ribulose 1,5-bisphosphate carboxylase large subunit-like protein
MASNSLALVLFASVVPETVLALPPCWTRCYNETSDSARLHGFVHTKVSRVIGASGIHVGTMSFGKMEGDASDKNIAFMLQEDEADGPYYHQEWQGMPQTTPIISGGMNVLRLPAFFENLGHSNVILTAGGGAFSHKDGPKQGAISCGQGEDFWMQWKAGKFGDVSLSDGVIEYAKTHEEIKGAFLTFQKDAGQIIQDGRRGSATLSSRLCRPPHSIGRRTRQQQPSSEACMPSTLRPL